jgi:hypothetical protein
MAIYHATLKSFSRGKGDSSVAAAAYRAGLDLHDERTDTPHRFAKRKGVISHHTIGPKGMPDWCLDPQVFWNANEQSEGRANARIARELQVALPSSLNEAQREKLALDLGQLLVDRYGALVLVAIHTPTRKGDQRNFHVHLLMSARQVSSKGLGERAGAAFEARQGGGTRELRQVRKAVGEIINAHLKRAHCPERVDHRTLKAQAQEAARLGDTHRARALSRKPTKPLGKAKVAILRKAQVRAELYGTGKPTAEFALTDYVQLRVRQESRLDLHNVPNGHSHEQALKDLHREHNGRAVAERDRGSSARAAQNKLRTSSTGPGKFRPEASLHTQYSGLTRSLSKVGRITRASGREDAEVLNSQAELIEQWLEVQRQAAQDALELLRSIPGIAIEAEFQQAQSTLVYRRVDSYLSKPFLFEDTETLAQTMSKYAYVLTRPHRARLALLQAKVDLSEHEDVPFTTLAAKARLNLAKAQARLSTSARQRQEWRINEARREMVEATRALEEKFSMAMPSPEVHTASSPDQVQSSNEGSGHWKLKWKAPRRSF